MRMMRWKGIGMKREDELLYTWEAGRECLCPEGGIRSKRGSGPSVHLHLRYNRGQCTSARESECTYIRGPECGVSLQASDPVTGLPH